MRILGIDPGLRNTGFGIVDVINKKPKYITSGVISSTSIDSLPKRLKSILDGLNQIICELKPSVVSIEKVFVNVNPQSTLLLGQARGVAIAASVLACLDVHEYTALQVKQSVVGYGHAEKVQVGKMVKAMLNLNGNLSTDAADALAVALTHMYYFAICSTFNISNIKNGRLVS